MCFRFESVAKIVLFKGKRVNLGHSNLLGPC